METTKVLKPSFTSVLLKESRDSKSTTAYISLECNETHGEVEHIIKILWNEPAMLNTRKYNGQ